MPNIPTALGNGNWDLQPPRPSIAVTARPSNSLIGLTYITLPPLPWRDGFTVLFVEDNPLIAIDAEDVLKALGVTNVKTAATLAAAKALLERRDLDVAFLDLKLGDENSLEIAEVLTSRLVPFTFATEFSDTRELSGAYPTAPVLEKPYKAAALADVLTRLTATRK
jgi:CheY-like chemotaxis protein